MNEQQSACARCGGAKTHCYQSWRFGDAGQPRAETRQILCVKCARVRRGELRAQADAGSGVTRAELVAALDRFFAASGVFELCARCHAQGTGCCPPSCRRLGAQGCRGGKTLFCATFICGALLSAISECAPELGRLLQWLKGEAGVTEWRVYEMFTRVPLGAREPERPLILPIRYPDPGELDGASLKPQLARLADEVLEVRRRWHAQELREREELPG